jgi:hypothetical protein
LQVRDEHRRFLLFRYVWHGKPRHMGLGAAHAGRGPGRRAGPRQMLREGLDRWRAGRPNALPWPRRRRCPPSKRPSPSTSPRTKNDRRTPSAGISGARPWSNTPSLRSATAACRRLIRTRCSPVHLARQARDGIPAPEQD